MIGRWVALGQEEEALHGCDSMLALDQGQYEASVLLMMVVVVVIASDRQCASAKPVLCVFAAFV